MELVGLTEQTITKISELKAEDRWIYEYRKDSFNKFQKLKMPDFGPEYEIDFDKIIYYKSMDEKMKNDK